jgi:prepilin-type N-terminal cleavage/methylation domain-containing protein
MSIQKKKGFTLIELMVVIVIIGILAAIAIPKLFGMSAKAKAQEVGPAAGTWAKLQLAYQMETGKWGAAKDISYKLPGESNCQTGAECSSETGNFSYTVAAPTGESSGQWSATNLFSTDDCTADAKWTAVFSSKSAEAPTMAMSNEDGCLPLTPNFLKIGVKAGEAPATPGDG